MKKIKQSNVIIIEGWSKKALWEGDTGAETGWQEGIGHGGSRAKETAGVKALRK